MRLAKLIVRQWTGPWYRAPGYQRILMPVAWLWIGGWVVLYTVVVELAGARPPVVGFVLGMALLGAWGGSLWRLRKMMPEGGAIRLSALAHGLTLGYIAGIGGMIWIVHGALVAGSVARWAIVVPAVGPLVVLVVLCRRGEKYIAQRCIRQYLVNAAAPDTIGEP